MDKQQFWYVDDQGRIQNFNLGKIIKGLQVGKTSYLVILDDGHERSEDVPVQKGKKSETQRQRVRYESQILLEGEDVLRLMKATSVDGVVWPLGDDDEEEGVREEASPVEEEIADLSAKLQEDLEAIEKEKDPE